MCSGSDISGVMNMYDSQRKIRKIVCITAGIWLISLLIFVFLCGKLTGKSQLVWISACTGYGIWNLCIFGCGYWAIRRTINRTMNGINAYIQHLIDGQKKQFFGMEEESSLGKFQNQIWKLYEIINGAKEREEKMRREMSGLIADLVHQINTPLTNIQMYCGFLERDTFALGEREKICRIIDSQVEKLGGFGDGFTKAIRLEEDVMQMRPTEQPILEMVLAAIDQIAWKAEQNGQEICLEGAQDICGVYDRRWTEEALFNLLDNAVKYGEKGRKIIVSMEEYPMVVRIDVKNYGVPLTRAEYGKVYQRFYRGNNAALVKEGVGLGLYLTRKILNQENGYVKAEVWRTEAWRAEITEGAAGGKEGDTSLKGQGSVFSIFLPKSR